jgi:hypothetical protein
MELARAISQDYPGTRVLIVSGYADLDEISSDVPRLTKPFRQHELAEKLRDLMLA